MIYSLFPIRLENETSSPAFIAIAKEEVESKKKKKKYNKSVNIA